MAAKPIYVGTIKSPFARIQNSDASNLVVLWTPGAAGSKIRAIGVSSTDTASRDLALYVTKSGVDYLLGTVSIPLRSGDLNNTPAVDLLNALSGGNPLMPWIRTDADGAKYIELESGAVLKGKALTTITSGKTWDFAMHGGDY